MSMSVNYLLDLQFPTLEQVRIIEQNSYLELFRYYEILNTQPKILKDF